MGNNFKLFIRLQETKHSAVTIERLTRAIEARFGKQTQIKLEHKGGLVNVYLCMPQNRG